MLDRTDKSQDIHPEPQREAKDIVTVFAVEARRVVAALRNLQPDDTLSVDKIARLTFLAGAVATLERSAEVLPIGKVSDLVQTIVTIKDALYSKTYDASFWQVIDAAAADLSVLAFASAAIDNAKHAIDESRSQAIAAVDEAGKRTASDTMAEIEKLLKDVSARGEQTVALVRKQVNDAVLADADQQFRDNQRRLRWQVGVWSTLSAAVVIVFFLLASYLMQSQERILEKHANWTWQLLYYGALRLAILGAIGAIASFCLRMLKAHLRLAHANAHRWRVVRSTPGFLEAAPEQNRFVVLEMIISSLVREDDSLKDDNPETLSAESAMMLGKLAGMAKSKASP